MNTRSKAGMVALLVLLAVMTTMYARARAQVVTPRPAELRYQALRHEPLANATRSGVVAGAWTLLVRDRTTGQCFLAVTIGDSVGLSPAECGQ